MEQVDLRDQVTAFVVYSGEEDFEACMLALRRQNCRFRLNVIDHVAPMDRAFQEMLDRCRTPYYVQVDADMVLREHAVLMMYQDLKRCPREVAEVCYPLLDPHLGFLIMGVKIYKHDVLAEYPYTASYSCEVGQLEKMAADGFTFYSRWPATGPRFDEGFMQVDAAIVAGEHSPTWTPETIFTRYKRLAQKYRRFGYDWMEGLGRLLVERVRTSEGRETAAIETAALVGWVAGMSGGRDAEAEQDWSDKDEDFHRLGRALWIGC